MKAANTACSSCTVPARAATRCMQAGTVVSRPPAPNRVQKFKLRQDLLSGHFKQFTDLWSRNPSCVTDLTNKVKTEGWSSDPSNTTSHLKYYVQHVSPLMLIRIVNPQILRFWFIHFSERRNKTKANIGRRIYNISKSILLDGIC